MTPHNSLVDDDSFTRLSKLEWDFPSAKTTHLTHNLHPYPAKFIPQIPNALIQELSSAGETVADIFCGSGTTLLEALCLSRHTIGIDANPLAALISRAKTTPLSDSDFNELHRHQEVVSQLFAKTTITTGTMLWKDSPFRSEGWRPSPTLCDSWFVPHVVEELAELLTMIDRVQRKAAHLLCKVAFSAIIVRVSNKIRTLGTFAARSKSDQVIQFACI